MNDPKTIEEFLNMLNEEKWKRRFGKVISTFDPQLRYVLVYLKELANKDGAKLEELMIALTKENSERIYNRIVDLLPNFNPNEDTRAVFVTAYLLTKKDAKVRHTMDWVIQAEKACYDLTRLDSCDKLEVALSPFADDNAEPYVAEARSLLLVEDKSGGAWISNVKEVLSKLRANTPAEKVEKDPLAEATWFKDHLVKELEGVDSRHFSRSGIFEARACLDAYQPTLEWVASASTALASLRTVKSLMAASATYKWWQKVSPAGVKWEPVEALKLALDAQDLAAIDKALYALKKFKPKCADPSCSKHVKRQGKGAFLAYCEDHVGTVPQERDPLKTPATMEQLLMLKRVQEEGDPVPATEFETGPVNREGKNSGTHSRRERGRKRN